ncbi:MAG: VTT domain-containing protein [bacterium]
MNILLTTDLLNLENSMCKSVLKIKEQLEKVNHEVKVLTVTEKETSYFEDNIYYLTKEEALDFSKKNKRFKKTNDVLTAILEFKPDIVQSFSEEVTFDLAELISNKFKVPFIHTYCKNELNEKNNAAYIDDIAFSMITETANDIDTLKKLEISCDIVLIDFESDFVNKLIDEYKKQQKEVEASAIYKRRLNIFTVITMGILFGLLVFGYSQGYFTSIDDLQELMDDVGIWGPLLFLCIQFIQVLFPVIPAGLSCLGGVVLFGPVLGFIYNYVGILIGSVIVFAISKKYGRKLVNRIFPKSLTKKYYNWIANHGKAYKVAFAVCIFSPVAPDDILCYIAGTTNMTWKEYMLTLIFCKPFAIIVYSLGLNAILEFLLNL